MKKLILGVVFGSAIAFNAFAANNNNPDVVIQGNAGSMHVSQCASVAGNCNNASINIEVGGNATINGSAVVVKGKDGADGKDGQRGEQGLKGEKGDRGQDGAAGTNGTNGKDGADGANGKDADMTQVNQNTSDIEYLTKDNERQDANHQTLKDGVEQWNKWAAQDSTDQWGDIRELQDKKANQTDLDREVQDRIDGDKRTNDAIAKETTDRTNADTKLNAKVDNNQKQQQAVDNAQNSRIDTEVEDRKAADVVQQMRIDQANANIEANRQASVATNKRVAANSAAIANHEQRIGELEKSTSKGFAELRSQIDDVKQDADAGIASVAAMANIPQVTEYQNLSVGAGVGVRNSQSAVAVGVSARLTENTVGKFSVASDSRSEFTAGAGISYGW